MAIREGVRCGGRSARIQAAVHEAVKAMQADGMELTVPAVASRAGVTPSTIYRRWGDLAELIADVAVERLRPAGDPADTGSLRGDLEAWVEQYADETTSEVGRALLRDVFANAQGTTNPVHCCNFTREQLAAIAARAEARGEPGFDIDEVLDLVVAPVMYRTLFSGAPPSAAEGRALLDRMARLTPAQA